MKMAAGRGQAKNATSPSASPENCLALDGAMVACPPRFLLANTQKVDSARGFENLLLCDIS